MSNGIIKIKEEYMEEAENRSKRMIQRGYTIFKQTFAGSINESSIGIEKYKNILKDEIKSILALQINFKDIAEKKVIDDTEKDIKSILKKYEISIEESEKGINDLHTDDDIYTKYALLGGYGLACLECSKHIKDGDPALLQKISDTIGEINIALSTGAVSLIEKDTKYIPKIVSVLKDKGIIKTQKETDLAILFAKNRLSNLRYALQREELTRLNNTNKDLNKLKKIRIQFNGYTISDLEVEDVETQIKAGKDGATAKKIDVEMIEWEDVIGQGEAKKRLRDEAVRFLGTYDHSAKESIFETVIGTKPPKTILLYGLPGTGKTMCIKALITEAERIRRGLIKGGKLRPDLKAENKRIHWNIITPDMIKNKYIGESAKAIKRVFDTAKKEAPSLIVIDEIDALSSKRGEEGFNEGEREIMAILMQELEGIQKSEGYILVGITNTPKCLDKALLSRFKTKVKFVKPQNAKEVADLFRVYLRSLIKIGAIELNHKSYTELGKEGFKLNYTGRWVSQFVEALERERNEELTKHYKNNKEIINAYFKDPKKMRNILNKKCKKFTIDYIKKKMVRFATDNKDSQSFMI